jgi:hypothetical protein
MSIHSITSFYYAKKRCIAQGFVSQSLACSGNGRLTAEGEVGEVYVDVVLLAGQGAVVTLQVVSVAGILSHPLYLIPAVGFGCHLGVTTL